MKMSQNNMEEFSVQEVFNTISNYLKNEHLYERLHNVLHEDVNFKRLLKTGEKQFFDSPTASTIEAECMKSRSCCPTLNYLVVKVDDGIDKIVQEKFQGELLDKLKDQVLQAILLLYSKQINNSDVPTQASTSVVKRKKGAKNRVLSQTKILTNNCTQNGNNLKKEVGDVINGHAQSAANLEDFEKTRREDIDKTLNFYSSLHEGDLDLRSLFSFDSVSSVHTSDLSSFEDEISVSSGEESGEKRRLSLKEVQEKLEKSRFEDMDSEEDNEQAKSNQIEDEQSDFPVNNKAGSSRVFQKSQRRRKPNIKYTDGDKILPAKRKKTLSSSRSVCSDTPRKRGRPRKYST